MTLPPNPSSLPLRHGPLAKPEEKPAVPCGETGDQRRRLRAAERLVRLGYWERDWRTERVWCSEETCRIFGLAPRELGLAVEELERLIHPEDRERFSAFAAGDERADTETREQEYRVVRPSGEVRHVHAWVELTRDDSGRPLRVFGVMQDITERDRSEIAVRTREREFRTLAEHTPDFIVRWDRELRRVYVNPAFAAAVGAHADELTGAQLGSYPADARANSSSIETLQAAVERVFASGKPAEQTIPWHTRHGEVLSQVRLVPEYDGTGALVTVLGVGRDVTAFRRIEDELRTLAEHSPDLIARIDREHRYLYVNPVVERLTGHPPADHLGRRVGEAPSVSDTPSAAGEFAALRRAIDEVFATGRPVDQEAAAFLPGGELILQSRVVPEFAPCGTVTSVLVIARDVTARHRAEAALHASEARMRAFLDQATDGVLIHAADGTIIDVNRRICEMLGREPDELIGRVPACFDPDLTRERALEIRARLDAGDALTLETRHQRKDGSLYPAEVHVRAFWHEGQRYAVAIVHDITERKRAEAALRASEQAYVGLVNSLDGIVWEADPTTFRFTFVSPQAERILGHPTARWLAESDFWERHLHRDDRAWAMNYCATCTRAGQDHEFDYRMMAADGRIVWFHDRVTFVPAEGERPARLRGLMVDITSRKQMEHALAESEQRFRQVVEAIDEIFWLEDATTGAVIYISPACERIWGRPCGGLRATPQAWLETVHPDDRARLATLVAQRGERSYDTEYRIIRPDGTIRHIHEKAFPIRDEQGRVFRIAGVAEDVTARCELADQLRQSQKMEAIGRLAGGVAHDFNNLLTAIQLQTDLLRNEPPSDPSWREGLSSIKEISQKAAVLTRQLLTFSRRQAKQARSLALRDVLDGMKRLIQPLLGENIRLVRQASPELPAIHADLGMMEQVILNLLVNARDALPETGGEITVSLTVAEITAANLRPLSRPGRFVCLAVADTGCGIPAENLPRIFEPFYTTKEPGKGTGLGLATAYGIVQEHQGWIEVESTVGRGTVFRVFLPALDQPAPTVAKSAQSGSPPAGRESILLVEDLPHVRVPTEALLRRLGYQVSAAASSTEALRIWEGMNGRCDLLLTDLAMPGGMNGLQLATELCRRQPTLRVIYTSGYRSPTQPGAGLLQPGKNFLAKPYFLEELSRIVRENLDEAPDRTPTPDGKKA